MIESKSVKCFMLLLIVLFSLHFKAIGQEDGISFQITHLNSPLQLTESLNDPKNNEFGIEILRFFVSDLGLLKDGHLVASYPEKFLLIDANNPLSMNLEWANLENIDFDAITFSIGIDSSTNDLGVQGGVLDPMNDMYWSWQSGYINLKLEGFAVNCPTRNNQFQFHIGGFLTPYSAIQNVQISAIPKERLLIDLNLDLLFQNIDIEKSYQIMSPSIEAVGISKQFARCFTIVDEE